MAERFFAIASLGKNRWYWVVWPSLEQIQAGELSRRHLADGFAESKAQAVEQALEAAGRHGRWVAAKYARDYYRQLRRPPESSSATPVTLEFLYRDVQDTILGDWVSVPHRIVKKTRLYVYVEQRPFDPQQRSGAWQDYDSHTFRLSRKMLEEDGYALTPILDIDDPLFFTTPVEARTLIYTRQPPRCFTLLGLSFPSTRAQVRTAYRRLALERHPDQGGDPEAFLELQAAYEQALRLCRE